MHCLFDCVRVYNDILKFYKSQGNHHWLHINLCPIPVFFFVFFLKEASLSSSQDTIHMMFLTLLNIWRIGFLIDIKNNRQNSFTLFYFLKTVFQPSVSTLQTLCTPKIPFLLESGISVF